MYYIIYHSFLKKHFLIFKGRSFIYIIIKALQDITLKLPQNLLS